MGRVEGKVAFVTGAGRGQGRAHAVRLAEEGADLVLLDIGQDIDTVPYGLASGADLEETAALVEKEGRRVLARELDVRDQVGIDQLIAEALDEFGRIDIAVANAGIVSTGPAWELSEAEWQDVIDVNLTGVWHTVKAVIPAMIEADKGGSLILTSSAAGLKGCGNVGAYTAAKHGVIGLMRNLAVELAPHRIRVNAVCPGNVASGMIFNDLIYGLFRPDLESPTREDAAETSLQLHMLPVPWIEPEDIAHAVLWLASDEARYVTGAALPVDAGYVTK
jgi:(+)-trans-carveol dehydrogenase